MVWDDPFVVSYDELPDFRDAAVRVKTRNDDLTGLYLLVSGKLQGEQTEDVINEKWELVREWFARHSDDDAHDAACLVDDSNATILHLACRYQCPTDIVETLLNVAPVTIKAKDFHGWLPLHYAAANLASDKVLQILIDTYPESTSVEDFKGRVPLHFIFDNPNGDIEAATTRAKLLSAGEANHCKDIEHGMIPFHYACTFGAPVEVLKILIEAYTRDFRGKDQMLGWKNIANLPSNNGKIALHYACVNSSFVTSPDIVDFLLELDPSTVNKTDDEQYIALRRLAAMAKNYKDSHDADPLFHRILDAYLKAKPHATAVFVTAVQELPEWLRDRAVITPVVQEILNKKVSRRLPTAFLVADFFFYLLLLVSFSFGAPSSIKLMADHITTGTGTDNITTKMLSICLLFSALYFFARELIQVLSFYSMGFLKTWFFDPTTYIDVLTIALATHFGIVIFNITKEDFILDNEEMKLFRWSASAALLIFWSALILFLTRASIEFSVFVAGLKNVFNRLIAFLLALIIILVAFAQIFVLIYSDSDKCLKCPDQHPPHFNCNGTSSFNTSESCDLARQDLCFYGENTDNSTNFSSFDSFCSFGFSFMKVYTMLLGEVADTEFFVYWEGDEKKSKTSHSGLRQFLGVSFFVFFMLLVVILLANVLIAIVTDSYGVILNERASIVFWTNRLDFVSEIDALKQLSFLNMIRRTFLLHEVAAEDLLKNDLEEKFGKSLWDNLTSGITGKDAELKICSLNFFVYSVFRMATVLFIIVWISAGLLSLGFLWPPQVRSYLLTQNFSSTNQGEVKELEQRTVEVKALSEEVSDLQDEIVHEMSADRREVVAMKAQFKIMKYDLRNEMKDIKQIVMMLFDNLK